MITLVCAAVLFCALTFCVVSPLLCRFSIIARLQIIQSWLGERSVEFQEMAARAKALGKPNALFDICRDLHTLSPSGVNAAKPQPVAA
jgi:hypothetical protein